MVLVLDGIASRDAHGPKFSISNCNIYADKVHLERKESLQGLSDLTGRTLSSVFVSGMNRNPISLMWFRVTLQDRFHK